LSRGLGQRLWRDIQKGLDAKRFTPNDPLLSFLSAGGTVMAAIAAELKWGNVFEQKERGSPMPGFCHEKLPDRAAAAVLQILGLERSEAEDIASQPLSIIPLGENAD